MNRYEETLNIDDIDIRRNISDFAGIIEAEYIEKIDRVISDIEARTTAEIAVVTLRTLGEISIDDAATRLFNKFGVGKKEENNGVLLLISTEDNQFRIEIGWGLESIINERLEKELVEKLMPPNFKKMHFGPAILKFTKKIFARIKRSEISNLSIVSWLSGILSLIFGVSGIFSSIVIALTSFPDITEPGIVASLFTKTCIPAVLLGMVSIIFSIADLLIDDDIIRNRKISKSIMGMIFGLAALVIIAAIFFFFPLVVDFVADLFSLPTGNY
ncbi:MAG: TPM domain-containing protein [Actinomycetia bacterium]|nr:TPM domain-containing protein [Actinomycetes bacterium]